MSADIYQIVQERIIEMIENEKLDWSKGWSSVLSEPRSIRQGYSGINLWILSMAKHIGGYGSDLWLTFNDIKNIEGARLQKGSKSEMVVFFKMLPAKNKDDDPIPMMKYYRVFNADCVDGLPEQYIQAPSEDNRTENERMLDAELIISSMPNAPKLVVGESNKAFYSPLSDTVRVPALHQYAQPAEYYSTIFHELGHATGHASRLGRHLGEQDHSFGSEDYSKEELVAEFTSAYVMNVAGVAMPETDRNSAAYIQGWLKQIKRDKKFIFTAAANAQRAANYILGVNNKFIQEN